MEDPRLDVPLGTTRGTNRICPTGAGPGSYWGNLPSGVVESHLDDPSSKGTIQADLMGSGLGSQGTDGAFPTGTGPVSHRGNLPSRVGESHLNDPSSKETIQADLTGSGLGSRGTIMGPVLREQVLVFQRGNLPSGVSESTWMIRHPRELYRLSLRGPALVLRDPMCPVLLEQVLVPTVETYPPG